MSTRTRKDDTQQFLDTLTLGVPEDAGLHTYLWTLPDKRSHWMPLDDVDGLVSTAHDLSSTGSRDVYVAVGAAAALPPAPSKRPVTRLSSENVAGLYGIWADVDIRDADAHKKYNLPETVEAAMSIVDAMVLKPTIVVHSGHGLQVWWLFNEFWQFESDDDRRAAASLAQRWNGTLRARAVERSQIVDSVFDLARVMRLPGTYNHKGDTPAPVVLLSVDENARHSPEEFEDYILDDGYLSRAGLSSTRSYVVGDLVLSEGAQFDWELVEAARANDPQFSLTWERKRKDFPDQSQSTYDMSIASFGANYGLEDQQIADLIIAHRKFHKQNPEKALRSDYITRTIAKARDTHDRSDVTERIEDAVDAVDMARATEDPALIDSARRDVLDLIGSQIGMEVIRITRYTSDPPTFRLITPSAAIDLGVADSVLRADRFRTSVWAAVGHTVPRMKNEAWDKIAALIPKAWVEEDLGQEVTTRGETLEWLAAYLRDKPPLDDVHDALDAEMPFLDIPEGGGTARVNVTLNSVRRHVWLRFREQTTNAGLAKRVREAGGEPRTMTLTIDGKRTSRYLWVLPPGIGQH